MGAFLEDGGEDLVKSVTTDFYDSAKKWFAKLDPTETKLRAYRDGLNESLNKVQILGMSSSRKLAQIYIALNIFPEYRKMFRSRPNIEEIFRSKQDYEALTADEFDLDFGLERLGYSHIVAAGKVPKKGKPNKTNITSKHKIDKKKIEGEPQLFKGEEAYKFIESNDKILVLGQPGGGKTTFLKHLALTYAGFLPSDKYVKPRIPIFIPLRDHNKANFIKRSSKWFLQFASICASETSNASNTEAWLKDNLDKGNCIILVDGLDEVPSLEVRDLVGAFRAFSNKYKENKFVASCRTAAYRENLDGFKICEINDFDDDDVQNFAKQWFANDEDALATFQADLLGSLVARDLCRSPLLTTMTCTMYDHRRSIPHNRFELYESCVDALLYRWRASNSVENDMLVREIGIARIRYILSNIARKAFDSNSIFIRKPELVELISRELGLLNIDANADWLLEDIESRMGIFIEHSPGLYCFSHLTFQEYFVAINYVEQSELESLVDLVYSDSRYREIFLLAMERTFSPDKVAYILASRTKYDYISNGFESNYLSSLIEALLLSQAVLDSKIRRLLLEVLTELDSVSGMLT